MKGVGYKVMEQEKENREMEFDDDSETQPNEYENLYSANSRIDKIRSRGAQSREKNSRTNDRVKINERKSIHAPSKTSLAGSVQGSRQVTSIPPVIRRVED